jgi:hypothetical protein
MRGDGWSPGVELAGENELALPQVLSLWHAGLPLTPCPSPEGEGSPLCWDFEASPAPPTRKQIPSRIAQLVTPATPAPNQAVR